ncbi:hypothetical protein PYCC9005_004903 [Savitreella phatthalungensis]
MADARADEMVLSREEYERYGRQMILPGFGVRVQSYLKGSRVLVVGCGGLGCPAIAYLAGAGIGTLGLCDGDTVDLSNLPRQFLHTLPTTPDPTQKTASAAAFIAHRNPHVNIIQFPVNLTFQNAPQIFTTDTTQTTPAWDIVLDCTDTQPVRYLISDLCVVYGIPLVSGGALGFDGQVCLYNTVGGGGACYRCMFPRATPAAASPSCGEAGVLGSAVGAIGLMQATEIIKLLVRSANALPPPKPSMHLYSAFADTPWRTIVLRPPRKDCFACAPHNRSGLRARFMGDRTDADAAAYHALCVPPAAASVADEDVVVAGECRMDAASLVAGAGRRSESQELSLDGSWSVIDVRPAAEFAVYHLPGAVSLPLDLLRSATRDTLDAVILNQHTPILLVCKHGNDSLKAQRIIRNRLATAGATHQPNITDLDGGLDALANLIHAVPKY